MQSGSLKSKKILGISVTTSPKKEILEYTQKYLEKSPEKPLFIATPNPEQMVLAQEDSRFAKILNQADVAIPDGIGLAWAAGVARVPGVELMEELVAIAAGRGYPIGLIGGRRGVAVEALECLIRKFPALSGWAVEPEEKTIGEIIKKIADFNTRLVFVGLGVPKQEYFIERIVHSSVHYSLCTVHSLVLMSVGGAFDMIAGRTPRAPRAIGAAHLEWLWRLVHEPWRFRRQLALLKFLWLVLRKKLA